ncbi:Membrane-bound inhibitor of C-type lysozyme [Erythrobacter litoralis]|nr:MliC family protein [Erythrobacter litoralis]AOL24651.1 Membrane-bound inhibitor of C-type lysozyme [Erythrobacter litoralis]MEE4337713.1 MliC family protein [Erythrobacter sp.]
MRKLTFAMAAGAVTLGGCSTDDSTGSRASAYYQCDRGPVLKVDYIADEQVQVQVGNDEPLILPQVPSASGAKYMTARHVFWDRGGEATWTVGRMMPMTCRKVVPPGTI